MPLTSNHAQAYAYPQDQANLAEDQTPRLHYEQQHLLPPSPPRSEPATLEPAQQRPLEVVATIWEREGEDDNNTPSATAPTADPSDLFHYDGSYVIDTSRVFQPDHVWQPSASSSNTSGAEASAVTEQQMHALTGMPSPPFDGTELDTDRNALVSGIGVDLEAYQLALGHAFGEESSLDSEFFDLDYGILPASTIPYSALGMSFIGEDEVHDSGLAHADRRYY